MIDVIGSRITFPLVLPVTLIMTASAFVCAKSLEFLIAALGCKRSFMVLVCLFFGASLVYPPVTQWRMSHHPLGDSVQRLPNRFVPLSHLVRSLLKDVPQESEWEQEQYRPNFPLFLLEIGILGMWLWGIHFLPSYQYLIRDYGFGSGLWGGLLLWISPVLSLMMLALASGTTLWYSTKHWKTFTQKQRSDIRFLFIFLQVMLSGVLAFCRFSAMFYSAMAHFRA